MKLYDIISEIAQKQCDKVYEIKISLAKTELENEVLLLNDLKIEFEDLVFTDTALKLLSDGEDLTVLCLQTKNCILVLDKIGEI